jgi:phosphoglycerate dehydrogenase-like enzyme
MRTRILMASQLSDAVIGVAREILPPGYELIVAEFDSAGLDVMIEEPPAAEHKLFGLNNIVRTPHMAGPSWENWKQAFRNSFDNIQRVARGEKPLWVIPELRG